MHTHTKYGHCGVGLRSDNPPHAAAPNSTTRIRKLKRQQTHSLPLVSTIGDTLEDQANAFSQHFQHKSSCSRYTNTFMQHKILYEESLYVTTSQTPLITEFLLHELRATLSTCKPSSPGVDNTAYTDTTLTCRHPVNTPPLIQ